MADVQILELDEERLLKVSAALEPLLVPIPTQKIVLSWDCANVLLQALLSLPLKEKENDILSSTTVTLVALAMSRQRAQSDWGLGKFGLEADRLYSWGRLLDGNYGEVLNELISDFFKSTPTYSTVDAELLTPRNIDAVCSDRLSENIALLTKNGEVLTIDRLILSLLDDRGSRIYERMQTSRTRGLRAALRDAVAVLGGRSPEMVRDASPAELALRVEEYALALSTIFRSASGEFSLALFGPWGSGKTTLARVMKSMLEDPAQLQETSGALEEKGGPQKYSVVFHNAWKFRSRPECWIFAYKSLLDSAISEFNPIERVALALRFSFLRQGPWALVLALLSMAIFMIPIFAKVQIATLIVSTFGFSVALYLTATALSSRSQVKELFASHARFSSVQEKLGMLALVGDDVRALLSAWTKGKPLDTEEDDIEGIPISAMLLPFGLLAVAGLIWLASLLSTQSMCNWLSPETFQHNNSLDVLAALCLAGSSETLALSWAHLLVLFLWSLLAFSLTILPWIFKSRRPDRVLLIVDDLDRCSPTEMLDVIEGMRLLLDDEVINRRLQILMLVDETALAHAIGLQYQALIEERAGKMREVKPDEAMKIAFDEITIEQNEKLFACHLRTAQLTGGDLSALIKSLASPELVAFERDQLSELQARRARQLEDAIRVRDKKTMEHQQAVERQNSAGERDILKDINMNRPSKHPVPDHMKKLGMIDAHMPMSPMEVEDAKRQQLQIDSYNARERAKSDDQLKAEKQEATRTSELLEKEAKEAEELVAELSDNTKDNSAFYGRFEYQDVRFTAVDVEQLQEKLPGYFSQLGRRASPRAIRILLFKIQLCRLLLEIRFPSHPAESRTVTKILEAFEVASEQDELNISAEDDTIRIARQVV